MKVDFSFVKKVKVILYQYGLKLVSHPKVLYTPLLPNFIHQVALNITYADGHIDTYYITHLLLYSLLKERKEFVLIFD